MEPIAFKDLDKDLQAMIATPTTIVNHADGEDLTVRKEVLKFADRHKATFANVYKGYVLIRRKYADVLVGETIQEDCVLVQDMINEADTIYEIRYDFNLNGETITVPKGCAIYFNGGRFHNGKVVLNGAKLYGFYELDILEGAAPGTTRWTSDGFIEWWNGTEWFNPYTTLNDALKQNIDNIVEAINTINTNIADGFKTINEAALAEQTARREGDDELRAALEQEATERKNADTLLNADIKNLSDIHTKDKSTLAAAINANTNRIEKHETDVAVQFKEVYVAGKATKDEIIDTVTKAILEEHNDRITYVATEIQKLREYVDKEDAAILSLVKSYRTDCDNITRHFDALQDTVNKRLEQYRKIIHDQQMAIINNQNRIDVMRDRIQVLEDNATKFHVMFVEAVTGKVLSGQYVISGDPAIAPDVPEGATYDKSFAEVHEHMIITVTV